MTWTDERIALLTDLWTAGKSGAECAKALGISRNAAIGKAYRLGTAGAGAGDAEADAQAARPAPAEARHRTPGARATACEACPCRRSAAVASEMPSRLADGRGLRPVPVPGGGMGRAARAILLRRAVAGRQALLPLAPADRRRRRHGFRARRASGRQAGVRMRDLNAVVVDLSPHPAVQWAVIWQGQLLPMRFGSDEEAALHLASLHVGKPLRRAVEEEQAA